MVGGAPAVPVFGRRRCASVFASAAAAWRRASSRAVGRSSSLTLSSVSRSTRCTRAGPVGGESGCPLLRCRLRSRARRPGRCASEARRRRIPGTRPRGVVATGGDLSARGVGLRVLAGQGAQVDTTPAAGRIFAALAERELIRERTVAGLKAARARGRKGGRKFALTPRVVGHRGDGNVWVWDEGAVRESAPLVAALGVPSSSARRGFAAPGTPVAAEAGGDGSGGATVAVHEIVRAARAPRPRRRRRRRAARRGRAPRRSSGRRSSRRSGTGAAATGRGPSSRTSSRPRGALDSRIADPSESELRLGGLPRRSAELSGSPGCIFLVPAHPGPPCCDAPALP